MKRGVGRGEAGPGGFRIKMEKQFLEQDLG